MQLLTFLNRCEKFKRFVYERARFVDGPSGEVHIEVTLVPRANSRAICSGCQRPGSVYDHLPERHFEFIPLWGLLVFFCYAMRRGSCEQCGVKVESVPWAHGKRELTKTYMQYHWRRRDCVAQAP